MPFQATISAETLKCIWSSIISYCETYIQIAFTKCLACLARYADDVMLQADPDSLSLSSINSSRSAFCQIKFLPSYFEKYNARAGSFSQSQAGKITGRLVVKSLLSILRHKTTDKILERCQLSIPDPGHTGPNDYESDEDEDDNSLELKLVVRLYCKHGITKTHKLLLLTPTNALSPCVQPSSSESLVIVGPRTLKDVLDHFPFTKGVKNHPQLLWLFDLNNVKLKTYQGNADARMGKGQLSTEISFSADEFESYQIHDPPSSIGFHIKEFNATVTLAEALSMSLIIRFTEPTSPIYIEFDSDTTDYEFLFIISTTNSTYENISISGQNNLKKRQHVVVDVDTEESRLVKRKPERVVDSPSFPDASRRESSLVRSSSIFKDQDHTPNPADKRTSIHHGTHHHLNDTLFLPGASQLSQPDIACISGKEYSKYEDFEAMMDAAPDSEVGMSTKVGIPIKRALGNMGDDCVDGCMVFPATQPSGTRSEQNKFFEPLFDD
ncbi:hypothetical protein Clacol_004285 [Clathrus columnatus]|uniref:Cell cycle checkpoint control protein RAD9A n=1 Tax=Clathrus columnatus TaxID=1419009 RepID=A0AAV5ABG8_9AGAM|nr:hypothetical protein Clacol_004285 [Clathrus columnatus]